MTIRQRQFLPLLLVLLAPIGAAEPGEDAADREAKRCINTGSILRARVIDDDHVVFVMRRDEMYLNTLRTRCTGLSRQGTFSYKTRTRSLCELESITIVEGGSLREPLGRSCTLGMFEPVTMEELTGRFAPPVGPRQHQEVSSADIEDVGEGDDEEQTPNE